MKVENSPFLWIFNYLLKIMKVGILNEREFRILGMIQRTNRTNHKGILNFSGWGFRPCLQFIICGQIVLFKICWNLRNARRRNLIFILVILHVKKKRKCKKNCIYIFSTHYIMCIEQLRHSLETNFFVYLGKKVYVKISMEHKSFPC